MRRWWIWGTSPNVETGPDAGGGFDAGRGAGRSRDMRPTVRYPIAEAGDGRAEGACGVVEPAQQSHKSAGRCGALALLLGLSVAACEVVSSVAGGRCGFGRAVGSVWSSRWSRKWLLRLYCSGPGSPLPAGATLRVTYWASSPAETLADNAATF